MLRACVEDSLIDLVDISGYILLKLCGVMVLGNGWWYSISDPCGFEVAKRSFLEIIKSTSASSEYVNGYS